MLSYHNDNQQSIDRFHLINELYSNEYIICIFPKWFTTVIFKINNCYAFQIKFSLRGLSMCQVFGTEFIENKFIKPTVQINWHLNNGLALQCLLSFGHYLINILQMKCNSSNWYFNGILKHAGMILYDIQLFLLFFNK